MSEKRKRGREREEPLRLAKTQRSNRRYLISNLPATSHPFKPREGEEKGRVKKEKGF